MGVYIKGELPKEFNGMTMSEAISLADDYLEWEHCDEMWDAVRALRDFCECVTDEAIEVKTPHGRLIDADDANERIRQRLGIRNLDYLLEAEKPIAMSIKESPTVIESEVE